MLYINYLCRVSKIQFSSEARHALELLEESKQNLFITGKAGTGKSTLLEHMVKNVGQDLVVLAPTGIAAIHVNGETLHSFFRLKPGYELDEAKHMRIPKNRLEKYLALKTLLIDEISMVRADLLDAVDIFLKRARGSREPFGGVRMIFFCDLHQLPPVVTRDEEEVFRQSYKTPWFFSAKVFQPEDLFTEGFKQEKIELKHIYRQSDEAFIQKLNDIRNARLDAEGLRYFDAFYQPDFEPEEGKSWVHLVATNAQANHINLSKLRSLPKQEVSFDAERTGQIGNLKPNDERIVLKPDAQVMFIQNDAEKRWVNGTLGKVIAIEKKVDITPNEEIFHSDQVQVKDKSVIRVKLENGKEVEVKMHTWPISKYVFKKGKFTREEIGAYTQMPLRLAWAITIHKSQGKTFRNVMLDMGNGGFAHGQAYVALSRCTSPKGLILKQKLKLTDIILDQRILFS